MYVYQLTPADVAASIGHLGTLTASSSPTLATVERWIAETCATVSAVVRRSLAVEPSSLTAASTGSEWELYSQIRDYVVRYVAARWIVANEHEDTDLARSYRIQFDQWLDRLAQGRASAVGGTTWVTSPTLAPRPQPPMWRHGRSYR